MELNIKELKLERTELEKRLYNFMVKELNNFYIKTGVAVADIHVVIIDYSEFGKPDRIHIVSRVTCELDI